MRSGRISLGYESVRLLPRSRCMGSGGSSLGYESVRLLRRRRRLRSDRTSLRYESVRLLRRRRCLRSGRSSLGYESVRLLRRRRCLGRGRSSLGYDFDVAQWALPSGCWALLCHMRCDDPKNEGRFLLRISVTPAFGGCFFVFFLHKLGDCVTLYVWAIQQYFGGGHHVGGRNLLGGGSAGFAGGVPKGGNGQ